MIKNRRRYIGLAVITVLMVCAPLAQADIPGFVDYHAKLTMNRDTGHPEWEMIKDVNNSGEPQVIPGYDGQSDLIRGPNVPDESKVKEVWLEIEWDPTGFIPEIFPEIPLTLTPPSPTGPGVTQGVTNLIGAPSTSGNGYTWRWLIEPQPAEEWFMLPPDLASFIDVASIEVGTFCATTTIHKPEILYGTLSQTDLKDNTCGPTATTNSFAYLERAYPETYGRKLIPDLPGPPEDDYGFDELLGTAQELADLMDWTEENGVTTQGLINGKVEYITTNAPGTTVFGAQMKGNWSGQQPSWVEDGQAPTWAWLNEQLVSCEDVEFIIRPVGGGFGHVMTLTGMTWQDTNNNGVIDPGEATINYIDPVGATRDELPVTLVGGELRMTYKGKSVYIDAAVKESVPEPATMTLLALGGLAVLRRRRRSR